MTDRDRARLRQRALRATRAVALGGLFAGAACGTAPATPDSGADAPVSDTGGGDSAGSDTADVDGPDDSRPDVNPSDVGGSDVGEPDIDAAEPDADVLELDADTDAVMDVLEPDTDTDVDHPDADADAFQPDADVDTDVSGPDADTDVHEPDADASLCSAVSDSVCPAGCNQDNDYDCCMEWGGGGEGWCSFDATWGCACAVEGPFAPPTFD